MAMRASSGQRRNRSMVTQLKRAGTSAHGPQARSTRPHGDCLLDEEVLVHADHVFLEPWSLLDEVFTNLSAHAVPLVLLEEPRYLASGEDRVEVLEEALLLDLLVRIHVQTPEIVEEGLLAVCLGDGDLESLVAGDCLPEPPTPTSMADPRGSCMMREILIMCFRASSKSTRFMLLAGSPRCTWSHADGRRFGWTDAHLPAIKSMNNDSRTPRHATPNGHTSTPTTPTLTNLTRTNTARTT
mmetsp:Transcript_26477/g.75906  ORF Transcript_26477/g.75906 Transcript_26477/m.75906 type:complete len:241 (+) Transcript_26477:612-1334(+)